MEVMMIPADEFEAAVRRAVRAELAELLPRQDEFITTKDVAKLAGVSTRTVAEWRKSKRVPFVQNGRTVRYRRSEIERWINDHRVSVGRPVQ